MLLDLLAADCHRNSPRRCGAANLLDGDGHAPTGQPILWIAFGRQIIFFGAAGQPSKFF
jgi:hypothetical protein